jgi:2-keto-4-pentenoate hydratase/2-oxohepta-3-ene-1,7-dioic acid hydratase in catechol pathway
MPPITSLAPSRSLAYPKDRQVWLKAGDQIACRVEKLGELRFELV